MQTSGMIVVPQITLLSALIGTLILQSDCQYQPDYVFGRNYTRYSGGFVEVECITNPPDPHHLSWYYLVGLDEHEHLLFADDEPARDFAEFSLTSVRTLKISPLQKPHTGYYMCAIKSNITDYKIYHHLLVKQKPRVWVDNKQVKADEGKTYIIPCYGSDVQLPLRWRQQDGTSSSNHWSQENNSLILHNTAVDHVGKYVCLSDSAIGRRMVTLEVDVNYKPNISMDITPIENTQHIRIICSAASVSNVTNFKILKDGSQIVLDDRVIRVNNISTQYEVKIQNVSRLDVANYECVAVNEVGERRKAKELNLRPSNLGVDGRIIEENCSIYFNLTWHALSFYPILHQTIYYRRRNSSETWVQIPYQFTLKTHRTNNVNFYSFFLVVQNLKMGHEYEVKVEVENELGTSMSNLHEFDTPGNNKCQSTDRSNKGEEERQSTELPPLEEERESPKTPKYGNQERQSTETPPHDEDNRRSTTRPRIRSEIHPTNLDYLLMFIVAFLVISIILISVAIFIIIKRPINTDSRTSHVNQELELR